MHFERNRCYLSFQSSYFMYVISACLRIGVSNTYCVVFLFCLSSSCMLPVSLDCSFLIAPWVFPYVHFQIIFLYVYNTQEGCVILDEHSSLLLTLPLTIYVCNALPTDQTYYQTQSFTVVIPDLFLSVKSQVVEVRISIAIFFTFNRNISGGVIGGNIFIVRMGSLQLRLLIIANVPIL